MARINLLPWREELREQRKQQFLVILGGVLVASAALVFLGDQYFTAAIENQNARNDFLRKEIVVLDARIKEISELKSRRQQLLERMKIIQDLQGNRPIIGRVFDQLVRTLPDGVYFTDLKMTGRNIAIAGAAESNNRVSNLMRNMDASEWLTAPTLNEVKAVTQGGGGPGQRVPVDRAADAAGRAGCQGQEWGCARSQEMSLASSLESLRKIDINDLDLNNIGSWPAAVKVIVCVLLTAAVLALGYNFHLSDMQAQLEQQAAEEETLKQQFSTKAFQAANLEAYKAQMKEMEESFGALLRQLPSDTEVPGLLEDITRTGLGSGLEFEEIKLLPEVTQQFYIELPIQISVVGGYHDLATFVSGVSSLPRIVTLHDFEIKPVEPGSTSKLRMSILAKTYRYNDKGLKK